MDRTHDPLHLAKWSFVHWKMMDIHTSFIWIIIFFDGAFECGGDLTFWGYVGTNAEILFVEFCNFVPCHTFISYYLVIVKHHKCCQLVCWRHNSDAPFWFHRLFIKGILNIRNIIYLECVTCAKESRFWV
jgi:hypothetical protein